MILDIDHYIRGFQQDIKKLKWTFIINILKIIINILKIIIKILYNV